MAAPAFVFAGLEECEKILVRSLAASRRQEPGMTVADMVENGIENEPHLPPLQLADQLLQRLLAAKLRIDGEEIGGVVLVVRGRDENRREIQGRHPEVLDVVEMVGNPRQIAAEKILDRKSVV